MDFREFKRFYLLKTLLVLVGIQIVIVAVVQNYNHKPIAKSDQTNVIEGRNVKISPLTNDTDKDATDKLTIKQFSKPFNGSVNQKGNLLFYTPNIDFVGADSFSYTVTDGRKESVKAFISIAVIKNFEPIAKSDIAEGYSGKGVMIDVLKNDNDREGDSIFIKEFSQPLHGKIELLGNQFVYVSDNSSSKADSFRYVASDGKSSAQSVSVNIVIKSKDDPCYPWLSCDIGDAALAGKLTSSNNKLVIEASGSDIWNNADGFRYAYQYVEGDCEISTKIETLEGTNEWEKAGVMIRESLSAGSKTVVTCITNQHGGTYYQRRSTFEAMEGGSSNPEVKVPYWVKLTRKGNTFSFFISANGQNWVNMGSTELAFTSKVYIGFALTSHNNGELGKATFSNYRVSGKEARF